MERYELGEGGASVSVACWMRGCRGCVKGSKRQNSKGQAMVAATVQGGFTAVACSTVSALARAITVMGHGTSTDAPVHTWPSHPNERPAGKSRHRSDPLEWHASTSAAGSNGSGTVGGAGPKTSMGKALILTIMDFDCP